MEISKSTPYVRYRENISSTLHKGTIHIESEYLDRERKTTIESIEGQTWQNMVNGENKEEEILPRLGLKIEGNEDILDSVEQHMSIDTIIGDVQPVANEDGTYTYEISTMEGSYAKTLDGENNFSLTSDGLVGDMYIKYNAQGEEVNGNIVMDGQQSSYTIENSNTGEIKSAILKGQTLVNLLNFNSITSNGSKEGDIVTVSANGNTSAWLGTQIYLSRAIERGKKYIVMWNNLEYTHSHANGKIGVIQVLTTNTSTNRDLKLEQTGNDDKNYVIFSCNDDNGDLNKVKIAIQANTWATEEANNTTIVKGLKVLEYQEGMENWDIPYFEGMQSVQMPVLTTSNEDGTKTNILTVNEDVTLRSNGSVCDELDLLTGKLTQRIDEDGEILAQEVVKTVDLSCINEQGESVTFRPFEGTMHVNTSSQTLPPLLDMSVPVEATTQNLMSFSNVTVEE